MARVALEGVRKIYQDRGAAQVAVHRIDLQVGEGEFLVLVGPSGCGKTTTLRMVAGLESISEGTIRIGDRVVNDVPARDRDIAMVFQNYALYPHLTVRDNLAFALKLRKEPAATIDQRVREAAQLLNIEDLLARKPRQLSGGQRQRVALGRAIVRHPQVFLFDEPLSNLDAKFRVQMRRELAALRRRLGTTTIYVTHDQVEAMSLGDRIVVMHQGRVQQIGTPLDIYDRPANIFVAGFLGTPPMNQLRGRLVRQDGPVFEAEAGGLAIRLPEGAPPASVSGGAVVLGVRPEAIHPRTGAPGFEGVVEFVEPLGYESVVTVGTGGTSMTLRVDAGAILSVGQALSCAIDPGGLHWFDAESGLRL
ncbi:MAG TPA: sn-glycerol-3-phosphate ABC transporter ATP-binding protein UgpC [Gemmatimonadales bacterium]|nr:sn-glycerol-3-phosphate ABC transporter ATP-binding protein UgpC [Gemmatimonadales bacterium]